MENREEWFFLHICNGITVGIDQALRQDDRQTNTSSNTRYGLGLSIVKHLTKAISCRIELVPIEKGTHIKLIFNS